MNIRDYIDTLFAGYEETGALLDFKEELESNLNDRIDSLQKKGLSAQAAYDKAIAELGDVSTLADELCLQKKQQVISERYMPTQSYIKPWRMVLYVILCAGIGFGLVIGTTAWMFSQDIRSFFGSLLSISMSSALGVVFLALTQETARREAMSWKRALWYIAATSTLLFGVLVFAITYFTIDAGLPAAVATLLVFVLPGLTLGAFLVLTEKDHSKSWVLEQKRMLFAREANRFGSPARQEKFGLFSGALWVGGVALFVLLTLMVGLKFSWLAPVATLVVQMLLLAGFSRE